MGLETVRPGGFRRGRRLEAANPAGVELDQEAGLVLEGLDLAEVGANAALLETIVMKLEGRMMPPPGGARPSDEERESLTAYLIDALDSAAAARPDLGRMAVHRLNRTEYGNAVRDLLGLEID